MVYLGNGAYPEIVKLGKEPGEFVREAVEKELACRKNEAKRPEQAKR